MVNWMEYWNNQPNWLYSLNSATIFPSNAIIFVIKTLKIVHSKQTFVPVFSCIIIWSI
jgi:hypothetical protein